MQLSLLRGRDYINRDGGISNKQVPFVSVLPCRDDGDSTEVICPFVDCVPLHALVAQMHMPENTTVEEFRAAGFSNAARVFKSRAGGWSGEMAMVVGYGSKASC